MLPTRPARTGLNRSPPVRTGLVTSETYGQRPAPPRARGAFDISRSSRPRWDDHLKGGHMSGIRLGDIRDTTGRSSAHRFFTVLTTGKRRCGRASEVPSSSASANTPCRRDISAPASGWRERLGRPRSVGGGAGWKRSGCGDANLSGPVRPRRRCRWSSSAAARVPAPWRAPSNPGRPAGALSRAGRVPCRARSACAGR